jgi:hypothetical protein
MKTIATFLGTGLGLLVALTLLIGVGFALDYTGFLWESFMAPKKEEMRRDVWENTRSFREGKRQELVRYMHQYNTQPDNRPVIASTVRLQFADVDSSQLEPELRNFINKCFLHQ